MVLSFMECTDTKVIAYVKRKAASQTETETMVIVCKPDTSFFHVSGMIIFMPAFASDMSLTSYML